MAAAGVVGPLSAQPHGAVGDVVATLALLAEAVILELQHGGEGEGVVGAGDVDVLRADAGIGPQDVLGIVASDGRDRAGLVVHVGARLAAAADDAADQGARMAAVLGPVGAGHDHGRGVVGLHAAVEQVQRLADDAARQHFVDGEALLVEGFRVVRGVLAVDRLDGGDLLGPRAVVVHVAHEGRREHLAGALPAVGAHVQGIARHRCRGARAGAADAHLAKAVHGAEDHHGLAHAGFHQADRHADQRLGRRAAAEHVHVEVEPEPEVAGDEGREGRIARLVGQHAVDVGSLQAGILDGVAHRPGAERARRHPGAARIGRLAHADDGVLVAKVLGTRGVGLGRHRHGVPLCLTTGQYNTTVTSGRRRPQSALRL